MTDKDLDIAAGTKVLKSFWNWSRTFNTSFTLSFDAFLNQYGKKRDIYLEGVGLGVRSANVSDTRIDTAMRSLALQSKGKIPKDPQKMFQYLSNEATKIDWIDATVEVGGAVLSDTLDGLQAVGNSIITSGKILNLILPAIILLFAYFWLNKKSGGDLNRLAGNAIKGLRK